MLRRVIHSRPKWHESNLTLIISNSAGGKTTVVMEIIQDCMRRPHPIYKKVILLSPTHELSRSYDCLPNEWKFENFEFEGFIKRLFEIQKKKLDIELGEIPPSERILLILDDCLGIINGYSRMLTTLAAQGRHYKISTIILSQHTSGLCNPILRSNSMYILLGRMNDVNRQKVVDVLSSMGPKQQAIEYVNKVFDQSKYRFIVLSNNPNDELSLYTYKVDIEKLVPNFRIQLKNNPLMHNTDEDKLEEQKNYSSY